MEDVDAPAPAVSPPEPAVHAQVHVEPFPPGFLQFTRGFLTPTSVVEVQRD